MIDHAPRFQFPDGTVGIRPLEAHDRSQLLSLARRSARLHGEWIQPPTDDEGFGALLARATDPSFEAWVVLENGPETIAGLICLSQIFRGGFQSAYASYWLGEGFEGRAIMFNGMRLMLHVVFGEMQLHRIEANIQPANLRSIGLVRRLGFVKEGFSEKYLKVLGEWKDHERWAIHLEMWKDRMIRQDAMPIWMA